jgi:putative membrane protein
MPGKKISCGQAIWPENILKVIYTIIDMNRTIKDYGLILLKGIGMGAADVVPGVSGGTIAFIVGIYKELIDSIKSINIASLKLFFSFKWKEFWKAINGNFLLSLVLGIGISIFSLAKMITFLLIEHPVLVWAFFFGLVLASTWIVVQDVKQWDGKTVLSFIIGAGVAFFITMATPAKTPDGYWFIFVCGAISICAMILPGISGSFILVLLGKYFFIMEAVRSLKISVLLTFIGGIIVGITSFSRILSFALHRFHAVTIATLSGFMLGSLNKVWPWKRVVETYIDGHGVEKPLVETNMLPDQYLLQAIVLAILGFAIVYFLEKLSDKK